MGREVGIWQELGEGKSMIKIYGKKGISRKWGVVIMSLLEDYYDKNDKINMKKLIKGRCKFCFRNLSEFQFFIFKLCRKWPVLQQL